MCFWQLCDCAALSCGLLGEPSWQLQYRGCHHIIDLLQQDVHIMVELLRSLLCCRAWLTVGLPQQHAGKGAAAAALTV